MATAHVPQPTQLSRRVADVLIDVLAGAGVDVVFGLPGGTIAPMFDALLDRPDIKVITSRHETAAMFSAAGYARTSGKIGVVMVTSGPGITNAITGLASAWCDGIPVLLIAGEVSRKVFGKSALQEGTNYGLDVVGMVRPVSKLAMQLHEPNAAPALLRRAIATAMSGRRGPVVLTLPVDVASDAVVEAEVSLAVSTQFSVDSAALDRAAAAMGDVPGKRRLIFAGAGCRNGRGADRLRELAEQLQVPVMTTPKGKGVFPEDHPLALGVYGLGGHASAAKYVREGVDVLLAVGTSLGELGTNGWTRDLVPRKSMIHVDIETSQMGRSYAPTQYVAAPAEVFLEALALRMPRASTRAFFSIERQTDPELTAVGPEGKITPQRALWEIQQALPRDTIYAIDAGEHTVFGLHYLRINSPDGFIIQNGLGSMGQSIPAALGAKLAKPKRTVAVICGDGGFGMCCQELATAAENRTRLAVFVMNDQRLGMVELGNGAVFGRTPSYPSHTNIEAMAASFGVRTVLVEKPGDILDSPLLTGSPALGPVVFDIRIDRKTSMSRDTARLAMLAEQQGRIVQ